MKGEFSANQAQKLYESWINGNHSTVIDAILKMRKPLAVATSAYILHYMYEGGDGFTIGNFLRRLETKTYKD